MDPFVWQDFVEPDEGVNIADAQQAPLGAIEWQEFEDSQEEETAPEKN